MHGMDTQMVFVVCLPAAQRACAPLLCHARRELNAWLDQAEVRRALHAAPEDITGRFQECTNRLNYTHDQPSMLANHRFLLSKGMRPHSSPRLHSPSPIPREQLRCT